MRSHVVHEHGSDTARSTSASSHGDWRLLVPAEWQDDTERRIKAGLPEEVGHREKWRLALDLIDEAVAWGLEPMVIVADAGYGQITAFRHGLAERGLDYVVAVRSEESAHPQAAAPSASPWSGNGHHPATAPRLATAGVRSSAGVARGR
ncbi:transposase [Streptomyces sp. NPDC006463]|uniref:transposase n=1 Tax=Streptomyces sp. NPDC006463 TaxID=3364746 RepID=UPI00368BEEF1